MQLKQQLAKKNFSFDVFWPMESLIFSALLIGYLASPAICAPLQNNLISQNWQSNYPDHGQPDGRLVNQSTDRRGDPAEYAGNFAPQSFPVHPYSPEFIAQSGERFAEQIRNKAIRTNTENSAETQAEIKAALYSGGAAAIHQGHLKDCWFESALASVARTGKGQQMLSEMIVQDSPNSYVIHFPRTTWQSNVTREDIERINTKDDGPWARVVETAAAKSYPNVVINGRKTARTPFHDQDVDVLAMNILTGGRAKTFQLADCSIEEIRAVLKDGFIRQQPMEASSLRAPNPGIIVKNHAYAVVAYNPETHVITLRNPWARSGIPSDKKTHPDLLLFGEARDGVRDMGGGLIELNVATFKKFYRILVVAQL